MSEGLSECLHTLLITLKNKYGEISKVPFHESDKVEAIEYQVCKQIAENAIIPATFSFVGVVDETCYFFRTRKEAEEWSRNIQISKCMSGNWEENPFCCGFYFECNST